MSALMTIAATPKPPVAKKIPHAQSIHGHDLTDDYSWMREKTSRAVLAHLKAENAYTDAITKPTRHLQESLYKEMVARASRRPTAALRHAMAVGGIIRAPKRESSTASTPANPATSRRARKLSST